MRRKGSPVTWDPSVVRFTSFLFGMAWPSNIGSSESTSAFSDGLLGYNALTSIFASVVSNAICRGCLLDDFSILVHHFCF